jgi:RNA polymerase sigma-70 factor, ECF subfamily
MKDNEVHSFETHRRALTGLAYRMLGSRADAEDVVQDAYLRWHEADHLAIERPRQYLGTVVTRLCLDRMKSAQARREIYVGQWLPEPVVDEIFDDDTAGDVAHDISVALILVLERLSPLERASFLLHEVFRCRFCRSGPGARPRRGRLPPACCSSTRAYSSCQAPFSRLARGGASPGGGLP